MRMLRWAGAALLLTLAGATGAAAQAAALPDSAGVRAALDHYLQGHATGDGAHMRAAFAPGARLFFVRDGELMSRTAEEYADGFSGSPAADEAERRRWIEDVHITGNAAVARVILDYPNVRFTDYMSLLRIGAEWRIVNKTFVAEPKTARPGT